MQRIGLALAGLCFLGACAASATEVEPTIMQVKPATPSPKMAPAPAKVVVAMTAATLAEDCGGTAPTTAPTPPTPPTKFAKPPSGGRAQSETTRDEPEATTARGYAGARARRACEQTSMQLSVITSPGYAPTSIRVKKVELVDDTGKLIGVLNSGSPTVWSDADGMYTAWNQTVAPDAKLAVSYALSKPDWTGVKDRASHSYVVRAVIVVGGSDQTVQREAHIWAPTIMPPNVRT
jgi:hypothetical protein